MPLADRDRWDIDRKLDRERRHPGLVIERLLTLDSRSLSKKFGLSVLSLVSFLDGSDLREVEGGVR